MKQESERFLPFLDGNEDIHSYCSKEVEPMNKECEEVILYFIFYIFNYIMVLFNFFNLGTNYCTYRISWYTHCH